jgi:hypothetical protein
MDFPNPQHQFFMGIHFDLSEIMEDDYFTDYVIQNDAQTYANYDLDLHFSVERFSSDEAETLRFKFEEETDPLNAVHDNYIIKRQESLYRYSTSIKKALPSAIPHPGCIQIVHGGEYDEQLSMSYFTATLEVDGSFYVFQMIGTRENMGYLYDDFLDILTSVRS